MDKIKSTIVITSVCAILGGCQSSQLQDSKPRADTVLLEQKAATEKTENAKSSNSDDLTPEQKAMFNQGQQCSISEIIDYTVDTNEPASLIAKAAFDKCATKWSPFVSILVAKVGMDISTGPARVRAILIEKLTSDAIRIRSTVAQLRAERAKREADRQKSNDEAEPDEPVGTPPKNVPASPTEAKGIRI